MSVFIRVHWLPTGFKNNLIQFIKDEAKFLTILELKSETWEEGKSSIENGVYSVKVSYDIDDHANFLNFAGYHRVNGLGALFQINGAPPKCLQCNKWGHIRKECPDKDKICSSCKKPGHEASNCWSSQAKSNNNNNDNDNNNKTDMDLEDLVSSDVGIPQEEVEIIAEKKPNLTTDEFKLPTQGPTSLEIKKEKIAQFNDHVLESIESVLKESTPANPPRMRTQSTSSTPKITFTNATFDKIRNNNNTNIKTAKKKVEQKRLKDEEKKKEASAEFSNMNAAALQASKQVKRQTSRSSVTSENKKSLTFTDDLD